MNPYNSSDLFGGSFNASAHYDAVKVQLASPETIRGWSHGEVKNPETINYRTYRPEKDGLFCEKIFGPTKDWECACGKYKRIKNKGMVCDRCGVEVTLAAVRRQRMGHIELAVPVSHIWFFKCSPSRMGLLLDKTTSELERILYYQDWLVIEPGETPLKEGQILTDQEYADAQEKYNDEFKAEMGAEAIRKLLRKVNLDELMKELEEQMENTRSKQNRKKIAKRMKVVDGFRVSNSKPEWMVLDVLPVIPPELRPLVPLEGGRFATSDLNDLYRRVINRNNRLRNLLALKTPDVIIRNEKRMLQEAVDAVFDNGRHGRAVTGPGNRPLKSLSEILKGKTGRFRQNLLGKRVDYSGRSVIVVGPELKFPQCGLPKEMALRLFEPFIIRVLKERGICSTVRTARKMIERHDEQIWEILEEVTKDKTVFLNRAPTLHRLSIQAFEPVLVEGKAIRLHPMVCTPFNADFDGDQMAVHVPLSIEAQMESKLMMLASTSIFSPASGKSVMTPTQDVCLGLYFLTVPSQQDKLAGKIAGKSDASGEHLPLFNDIGEVEFGIAEGCIDYHSRIRFRNPDFGTTGRPYGVTDCRTIVTTAGRVVFNNVWPKEMGFWNDKCSKSTIGKLILDCHKVAGHDVAVGSIDKLKELGYRFATFSGASMGLKDMIRPEDKDAEIAKARKEADKVQQQFQQGIITDGERHNKIVDIWSATTEKVGDELYKTIDKNIRPDNRNPTELNPVYMFVDSKARGSKLQIRQLAGMRGLMANPSGDIIERPITASFREGLSVLEYFISSHGARKGLADTALKTADAGYLTRKLVDVSQDVIITQEDCNTVNGIEVEAIIEGDEVKVSLGDRVLGRTALYDVQDPKTGEVVVPANEIINEEACKKINALGIEKIWIRSGLTCDAEHGMCAKCYGRDLSTGRQVEIGTAVGIIAAQSIGEPGTQLTMRTFHIGGTASATAKVPEIVLKADGVARFVDVRKVRNDEGKEVVLNKNGSLEITATDGTKDIYQLQMGTVLLVEDGAQVKKGQKVAAWDPHSVPVLSESAGTIVFVDFEEDVSVKTETDRTTGASTLVVLPTSESNLHPRIEIHDADNKTVDMHDVPTGAIVMVRDGMKAAAGMLLAKTPREAAKTRDITGGLPRVAELFEARQPKDAAEIAKIEGVIDFGDNVRGKRCVKVVDDVTGLVEEHLIPMGKQIVVFKGDRVKKGQQLTEGPIIPQEILEVSGPQELEKYLVNEVQQVYRLQGVEINDKHIEIIVRQMLRKVRITNPGDTDFLWGEQVTRQVFLKVNERMMEEGRRPAEAQPALLGITKAALETDSFISAASFQDTTRVLTEAATMGRVDELRGFKENVILGHLIPGGTGFPLHRYLKLVPLTETISDEEMEKLREEQRKKHEELYGLPAKGSLPGEEGDDNEDEPAFPVDVDQQRILDNGDSSADGADAPTSDDFGIGDSTGGEDLLS
ncbi:MAG: DNA-directed RNA polymerase subunit beta' [Lentisphaerae bacterium]|jgi:DNA-directed RNA polymerase subunit beta'|nr:DNA-directed RNA polymerase subunit beta' [Lentisphaerota bacterium]